MIKQLSEGIKTISSLYKVMLCTETEIICNKAMIMNNKVSICNKLCSNMHTLRLCIKQLKAVVRHSISE